MKTMEIKIPYPKVKSLSKSFGLNAIYTGKHWKARQADAKFWHSLVHSELVRQGVKKQIFKNPVRIYFFWNDKMDCSNHAYMGKMIEDALKGWLIEDDSRKYVKEITHGFHSGNFIFVRLEEVR